MPSQLTILIVRSLAWWIRRNPAYLLSAALMAVGARLYLVTPNSPAGDLGLIFLTAGVLQLYKWAVTGILLALHRARRAPEDQSSLLLVAALFWTGPLAATVELAARDARAGLLSAAGVWLFAAIELLLTRRALRLPLSLPGRALALGAFALLVLAPAVLHVEDTPVTNELFLYGCWWLLAALALLAIPALRTHAPAPVPTRDVDFHGLLLKSPATAGHGEGPAVPAPFPIPLVLVAAGVHLYAMNYAFCGHARAFYAGPLLLIAAAAIFDTLAKLRERPVGLLILAALLPALAATLALQPFDPEVPIADLPPAARDIFLLMLAGAAGVYWLAARRLRQIAFFHLGNLALAAALLRVPHTFAIPLPSSSVPGAHGVCPRDLLTIALLSLTSYLLLVALVRRSRGEAVLGLLSLQLVVFNAAYDRPDAVLLIGSAVCWSLLIAAHLGMRPPSFGTLAVPAYALLAIALYYDYANTTVWPARANVACLIAVFALAALYAPSASVAAPGACAQRRTYALVAATQAGCTVVFYLTRAVACAAPSPASLAVGASFVLLVCGAAGSWNKHRLLSLVVPRGGTTGGMAASDNGSQAHAPAAGAT